MSGLQLNRRSALKLATFKIEGNKIMALSANAGQRHSVVDFWCESLITGNEY